MGKRTCWNGCKIFGFDFDQGAKAFSVAEFCIAFFNLRSSIILGNICHAIIGANSQASGVTVSIVMEGIALILFLVSLLVQTGMGFFLHFYGWKKRNVTVCWIWFVSAIINVFYPTFIYLSFFQKAGYLNGFYYVCEYYLLYNIYGCWIIYNFVKWAESKGIATEFRVQVDNEPDDVESNKGDDEDKRSSVSKPQNPKRKTTTNTAKVTPTTPNATASTSNEASPKESTPKAKKEPKRKKTATSATIDTQKTDDYF